jgi:RHS repeat-associated protein
LASLLVTVVSVAPASASTYSSAVLALNPTSYLRLNDGVDSAAGKTGVASSGVDLAQQPGAIHGDGDGAALFHPASWVYYGNDASNLPSAQLTVEAWIKGGTGTVFEWDTTYGSQHLMVAADGTLQSSAKMSKTNCGSDCWFWLYASGPYVADGAWHHVALLIGDGMSLYVDGAMATTVPAVPSTPASYPAAGSSDAYVGATGLCSTCDQYNGEIDEVATYPSLVSLADLQGHYTASGRVVPTPLVGGPMTAGNKRGGSDASTVCLVCRGIHTNFPVDASTGNFFHTFDDLAIPGRGPALDFAHTYNSDAAAEDGRLGFGWRDSYGMALSIGAGSTPVTVNQENGAQVTFTLSGSTYTAPPWVLATLVHNGDGTWTFQRNVREVITFDSSGNLTSLKDLNNNTTSLTYSSGKLATITDSAARTVTVTWTGSHITGLADQAGRTVTFGYDGSGNLNDVIDVGGGHTTFTYDASHRLLTMRSPKYYGDTTTVPTPVVTNHYDAQGRVDWQTDPLGRQTTFDYTTIAGSTKITDPNGNAVLQRFQDGLVAAETLGYGTPQAATWTYVNDSQTGGPAVITDPRDHSTTKTFDARGNVLSVTDPLGRVTSYTYDAINDLLTTTEPKSINGNAITQTQTFDAAGNRLTASAPLRDPVTGALISTVTTVFHRDNASHPDDVTSITDARTKTWSATYNASGDVVTSTDPLGDKTQTCYDNISRKTATISPRGFAAGVTCATASPAAFTTYHVSDPFRRVTTATDPLGHSTVTTFDADGHVRTVKDPDNNTTTYDSDPAGQLVTTHRADGSTIQTGYDGDGNAATQIDAASATTTYQYLDGANPSRTTSIKTPPTATSPTGQTTTFAYDRTGNLLTTTDPQSRVTTNAYDAANQLVGITYSDGVTPNVTNITYDADGQRTAMTDGTGTSTWSWDSLHRLTSSTNGAGATVGYGYDPASNVTSIVYPSGAGTVSRTYDDASRLKTVQDWLSHTTTYNYDADSNPTSEVFPNTRTATNTFDGAGRLMTISDAPTATPNSPYAKFTYGRDNANQLTSVTSTGVPADTHTWSYNQLNQLKTDTAATNPFAYDAGNNLTQLTNGTAQTFDPANELTATSAISMVGTPTSGGDNGTTTSLTIALPSGVAANDQTLVAVTVPFSKSVTTPTGYTVVGTYTSGSVSTSAKVIVYRRTNVAGDTNVVINFGTAYVKAATVTSYRGVSTTQPIDISGSGFTAGGTSVTAPSVTTTMAGDQLVVIQGAEAAPAAGTWTAPPGMTQRVQKAGGTSIALAVADQLLGVAGATGTRVATFSQTAQLVDVSIALKPAQTAYSYDLQGNRVTKTPPTGAAISYTFDQANHLTAVGTTTYRYDGNGLRASKTVAAVTSAFAWDQSSTNVSLAIVDGTTKYVYGLGGRPLEQISGTTVLYYNHDQLGSTRVITNSTGTVVGTYSYDAYGRLSGSTGSVVNPFGYAGEYTDLETGFQYLRARYYDPQTGQFLNRDPVTAMTRDPYGYAARSPLTASDPTGLYSADSEEVYAGHGYYAGSTPSQGYSEYETYREYKHGDYHPIGGKFNFGSFVSDDPLGFIHVEGYTYEQYEVKSWCENGIYYEARRLEYYEVGGTNVFLSNPSTGPGSGIDIITNVLSNAVFDYFYQEQRGNVQVRAYEPGPGGVALGTPIQLW